MADKHQDSDVIDAIGTTGYLAQRMGLSSSTISSWRVRGVPKTAKKTLYLMYPKIVPKEWAPAKVARRKK